jgi:hypothetical protein
MVEVFKTNVRDPDQADTLIDLIHQSFKEVEANFDLDDCDRILRVESSTGAIPSQILIEFLTKFGCQAEVLPDEIPFLVP